MGKIQIVFTISSIFWYSIYSILYCLNKFSWEQYTFYSLFFIIFIGFTCIIWAIEDKKEAEK